jgi:protein-S-isoprenylcysteine O-methyltransferase Ste14
MYGAGILFFLGYALATSPTALVPLAALAVLFRNKAALEEDLLVARYPDYREYRERVRGAFVPRR